MENIKEFQEYVKSNLKKYLSEDVAEKIEEINLYDVTKNNNNQLHGITVLKEGENISPAFYLDELFEEYQKGSEIEDVMIKISKIIENNIETPKEFSNIGNDFLNYENVKEKIIMVLINTEKNEQLLENVPHKELADLSVIFKVLLECQDDGGYASITVKNEHLEYWNVTQEEMEKMAVKNTKELLPIQVRPIIEVMKEMLLKNGMPEEMIDSLLEVDTPDQMMYMISNKSLVNGAASILYEESLAEVANKMNSDLYILPSSVHECLLIPSYGGTIEELKEMVCTVNLNEISPEEQLSDNVYFYSRKEHSLTLAESENKQNMLEEKCGLNESQEEKATYRRSHAR